MRPRSTTSASSAVPKPGTLWPPPRMATAKPAARAALTAAMTSATPVQRTTTAGRLSIIALYTLRASSYRPSSGRMTSPRTDPFSSVATTARRAGAVVTGVDLTPELLAVAKENATIAGLDDVVWKEGDVESLPFADGEFDMVLSQFAHIFAPRPEVAVKEMLRVLKRGGVLAFHTWPPELLFGRVFALISRYMPPAPDPKPAPPGQWGDPMIVLQRLGTAVRDVTFDRGSQLTPALSPQHYRHQLEQSGGPPGRLLQTQQDQPARLAPFRHPIGRNCSEDFDCQVLRQDFFW